MSDLSFTVDTSPLARAVRALEQVDTAAAQAAKGAGRFVDAAGRLREANGRFVTTAQQATEAAQRQGRAVEDMGDKARRAATALSGVRGIVAGFLSAETVRRALLMADAYATIGERLKVVSESSAVAAARQQQLVALAIQTRTPLDAVAQTFQRIAAVSSEIGVTQGQVLTVTKAIAQSFRVSGATAGEAAASSQQLAQALGSGRLQGDELRSILENNLTLAQAIAAGFGVSVGQLRAMGAAGELTSRDVFAAIERQAGSIASKFGQIGPTLGSGVETFNTGLTAAVGRLDTMLGLTRAIGSVLTSVGESLGSGAFADTLFQLKQVFTLAVAAASKGGFGAALQAARDLAAGRSAVEAREAAAVQRAADARQAGGRFLTNPLASLRGGTVTAGGFGVGGLRDDGGLRALLGIGPRGFEVGAAAAGDGDLAALARAQGRARREATRASERTADALARWRRTQADAARGPQIGGAAFASSVSPFDARLGRARELVAGIPRLDEGGMADRVRANMAPMVEAIEQAKERADELRRVFTEQLARGVQDGLAGPIATFLRTWQLNVKSMGDALRDALVNAVSAALANAVMRKLFELFERLKQAGQASQTSQIVNAATSLAAGFGGMGGGMGIPGVPRLGGAGGAPVKTPPTTIGIPGMKGLGTIGVKTAAGVGLGGLALGGILGRRFGTGAGIGGGILGGVAAGAAFGGPVGAVIGGVAGAIGGLFGGRAKRNADRARADASRSLLEDLGIRNAAAAGNDSEAARLRLLAQQRDELKAISDRFGARSKEVERLRQTQAAELRALTDSVLGPGVYMGPAGFNPNNARFEAGRPTTVTGNTFNITVPEGTTSEQARAILDEFGRMAAEQGLPPSSWSQIQVQ